MLEVRISPKQLQDEVDVDFMYYSDEVCPKCGHEFESFQDGEADEQVHYEAPKLQEILRKAGFNILEPMTLHYDAAERMLVVEQ